MKISFHEKSNLLKYVHALRGSPLPESEKYGFRMDSLLGSACQLIIAHGQKQTGETVVRIEGVTKLPPGKPVPTPTSGLKFFDFDSPDIGILHSLPDWMQRLIGEGQPWSMETPGKADPALKRPVADVAPVDADYDDDIPFGDVNEMETVGDDSRF